MSYATSNGIDFYYDEQGEGEPIVLLHGGIGSGELFAALAPALAAAGRRVITVDLQGHGRTGDVDRPFDIAQMADDVAGMLGKARSICSGTRSAATSRCGSRSSTRSSSATWSCSRSRSSAPATTLR